MPTSTDPPELLIDTSVAIPLLVADHQSHDSTSRALERRVVGLAGHAYFETYSVLTRLPAPLRRSSHEIALLLQDNFPSSRFLEAAANDALVARLGNLGIAGGAVYDVLVGSAALAHNLSLATRDRRAVPTYQLLTVKLEILD